MPARCALVLTFALGTIHFNGASARAEKCGAAAPDDIVRFFSPVSLPGATPVARGNTPDKRIGPNSSFVRFSVRSWFTMSGSAVTYSARSLHEAVARVDDVCGSMLTVTARSAGTATIQVTASANGMADETRTLTVEVDPNASFVGSTTNSPPVAEGAIPDTTFTQKTSPIRFVASRYFTDPDLQDSVLTYTAGLSRAGIVNTSITDSTLTITPVSAGAGRVTVTATDPGGLSAAQEFGVTVNNPPEIVVDIPDQTLFKGGSSVTFDLDDYFSDPDPGDDLGYSASSSPDSVASVGVSGSTLTISSDSGGSATVTVTATDLSGAHVSQSVVVTVYNVTIVIIQLGNNPPVFDDIPDQTLTAGGSSVTFDLNEYFSDPDPGDDLDYEAESSDSSVVSASVSDSTLTITPGSAGSATVTVTDDDGESVTTTRLVSFRGA